MKTQLSKIYTFGFDENFIERLAEFIEENFPVGKSDLSRVAVVFGGKRPGLFLKRELAHRLGGSFYPPTLFTIDEFMEYTVFKKERPTKISDLDLSYLVYSLAKEKTPLLLKGRGNFSEFLPWAREIVSFTEQVDLEDIPNSDLKSIENNAAIGYAIPEDINLLLEHITVLREASHQALEEKNMYSRGLQYLKASRSIDALDFPEFDQILFCHFFSLHQTEARLIRTLLDQGKASLFFQGSRKEWSVLEENSAIFGHSIEPESAGTKPPANLKLYSGFDTHSQVCLVREILKELLAGQANPKMILDQTVIVLPEPNHVIPLLSEVSSVAKDFNVSMGYPLKRSSFYSLFDFIFEAQKSRRDNLYYAKDYLKALRHPFVKSLELAADPSVTRVVIHKIEEILKGQEKTELSGSLFFSLDSILNMNDLYELSARVLRQMEIETSYAELKLLVGELNRVLFSIWEGIDSFEGFATVLESVLNLFVAKSSLHAYPLNMKIAAKIFSLKEEFKSASFAREVFPLEEIFKIFQARLEREIVAFTGSPLKGLQILGLFETRSLNFENVIVMDTNEGVLPRLQVYEPLIPREVMISLKLDRLEKEEEIQRYQLMRLVRSAKNVFLLYEESRAREKSRFIEELVWERQKEQKSLEGLETVHSSFEVKVLPKKTSIPKTPEVIEFLKNFRYSATSVNTYLRCPLRFYYNYVLGLNEREDLLDDPENKEVGTFLHGLLEDVFRPYIGKTPIIDEEFRERFLRMLDEKFSAEFERTMRSDAFLLKKVLEVRLKHFVEKEAEAKALRAVKEVVSIEQRLTDEMEVAGQKIKFVYKVDRIDRLSDGTFLILDYKTGSNDPFPKSLDRIAQMELSREAIKKNIKSFQIPMYFHYFDKNHPEEKINAAFYNLRTLDLDAFFDESVSVERKTMLAAFMRALDFIFQELLNEKKPFLPDDSDPRFCAVCPYFYMCR